MVWLILVLALLASGVAHAQEGGNPDEPSIFDTPTPTPTPVLAPSVGDAVIAERLDGTTVTGCLVAADAARVVISTDDGARELGIPRDGLRDLRVGGDARCKKPRVLPRPYRDATGFFESLGGRAAPGWAGDVDVLYGASASQVRDGAHDTLDQVVPLHGRSQSIDVTVRDVGGLPLEGGVTWTQRSLSAARSSMATTEIGVVGGADAETPHLHAFLGVEAGEIHSSFDDPSGRTVRSRGAVGLLGTAHVFVWRGLAIGAAVHGTFFPAAAGHDFMFATDESLSLGWRF